jgi:hypothetical protein
MNKTSYFAKHSYFGAIGRHCGTDHFFSPVQYYISKWLKGKLRGSKIVLHYLPGYSPNLNLIERLWKFFKKKILYNTYYEKYEDFLAACKNFFRCRTKYRDELRSLLTENFQQYAAQ